MQTTAVSTVSESKAGWTGGLGFEWKFTQDWSGFVEGNYYEFNKNKILAVDGRLVRIGQAAN